MFDTKPRELEKLTEYEKRILENQEIILLSLSKLMLKHFSNNDTGIINALINCYHETRKANGKNYINRGKNALLSADYYEYE